MISDFVGIFLITKQSFEPVCFLVYVTLGLLKNVITIQDFNQICPRSGQFHFNIKSRCQGSLIYVINTVTDLFECVAQRVLQGQVLGLQGGVVAFQLLQTCAHDIQDGALDGPHSRRQ